MISLMEKYPALSKWIGTDFKISGEGKEDHQQYEFKPLRILGEGVNGLVFHVSCESSTNANARGKEFALKTYILEKPPGKRSLPTTKLYGEFWAYKKYMNKEKNFDLLPLMIDYFVDKTIGKYGCEILVFEAFDMSLADFFSTAMAENRILTPRQYCMLAQKLIYIMYEFNNKMQEIHFDVKPANVLIRLSDRTDSLFTQRRSVVLCDFGSAVSIKHMNWQYIGTKQWMSRNTTQQNGSIAQTFVDDMEAIGYILVAGLRNGFLPWREKVDEPLHVIFQEKENMINDLVRYKWQPYIGLSNSCCVQGSETEMKQLANCLCNYFIEIERLFETGDKIDLKKLQTIWNIDYNK